MKLACQVAAGHPETARAAALVLRQGGNAVDAAVAASLAAFVAEPLLCSAGGGGMLLAHAGDRAVRCFDFFPDVPGLGGVPEAQRDFQAIDIDFGVTTQRFHVGRASACVPTVLEGLAAAVRERGRLPLEQVAAPAIELARQGARLGPSGAEVFNLLWPILSLDPAGRRVLANGDEAPTADTQMRNPAFAAFLRQWAKDEGRSPATFRHSMLRAHGLERGGSLTPADFERAAPRITDASTLELGAWTLHSTFRPGARAVERMMQELDLGPRLDEGHLALALARAAVRADALKHDPTVRGSTTHISVCDGDGGVASVTLSNGEGCGYVLRDEGIQLNNFLGEEDLNPGGFFRHAPGSELPTMMAPTVATHPDGRVIALGSGGANRIRSAVTRVLESLLRGDEGIESAVRAPRVHAEGERVWFERAGWENPDAIEALLREHFAELTPFDERAFFFGGVHAVAHNGQASAGCGDARRGGVCLRVEF